MTRSFIPYVLVAALVALALALAPASASAATISFRNSAAITIPEHGSATPSPATVPVNGIDGPLVSVEVTLNGISHTRPQDLDLLLVAPDGKGSILMSDVCGTADVANHTWTITSAVGYPNFGDTCPDFFYRPTNPDLADDFPGAPAGPYFPLSSFHRRAMNGQWKLYVVDDQSGDSGRIARGWALTLTTGPVDMLVPGTGTSGPASPYAATQTVSEPGRVIRDLNVILPGGLAHDRPDDLDLLLVGPRGQSAMLMSDACGTSPVEPGYVTFDDEGPNFLPDGSDPADACYGTVKPSNYEGFDVLPGPAPGGPHGTLLDVFDGTDPNGEWQLYAADDTDGGEGYLRQRFQLQYSTRIKANVELAESAVEVVEGTRRSVTIRRSANDALGAGTVTVTSTPGSATRGEDFTPFVTNVRFSPSEREKTVELDAVADVAAEGPETYSVALSDPSGDALLGAQTRAEVTIPPSVGAGAAAPPTAAMRCAGKRATIVGTARRDVLRGTRRADVIVALGGNDTIRAARGNDVVCAGSGNDRVLADPGNDRVLGEAGRDTLGGGSGRDRLLGGNGNDRLSGDRGRDTCDGGRGRDRANCERKR